MQGIHWTGAAVRCTRNALLAWTLTLAGTTLVARAEGAGPGVAALTLEQALERALARNKDLAAFEHRAAEEQGRVDQAGLLPNPELDLIVEQAGGSGEYEGFDRAETTLSLAWAIEGRARAGRVDAAEAQAALVSADMRMLRIRVAADTAEHFLASLASQARLAKAEEAIGLGQRAVEAVGRRVRAGRAPQAELARAEAELATDRLDRDHVTHELAAAYRRLAAQWGETTPRFSRVAGDLLALPIVEPYPVLAQALERNPRLARHATRERLAQANLRLAQARRWPVLRPRLGVRRFEESDDVAFLAGVSVPIPLLDRRQGEIAGSRASVSRARAEADAARVRLRTTLFELYEELEHHLHRAEMLRSEVIPRLEEALEGTRRAYAHGRYAYAELRSVQTDLLHARSERVEASAGAHRLVIALERLLGEPVVRR